MSYLIDWPLYCIELISDLWISTKSDKIKEGDQEDLNPSISNIFGHSNADVLLKDKVFTCDGIDNITINIKDWPFWKVKCKNNILQLISCDFVYKLN